MKTATSTVLAGEESGKLLAHSRSIIFRESLIFILEKPNHAITFELDKGRLWRFFCRTVADYIIWGVPKLENQQRRLPKPADVRPETGKLSYCMYSYGFRNVGTASFKRKNNACILFILSDFIHRQTTTTPAFLSFFVRRYGGRWSGGAFYGWWRSSGALFSLLWRLILLLLLRWWWW